MNINLLRLQRWSSKMHSVVGVRVCAPLTQQLCTPLFIFVFSSNGHMLVSHQAIGCRQPISHPLKFIGSALPPMSILAYFLSSNIGVGAIWSTALDSRRFGGRVHVSKVRCSILRFAYFRTYYNLFLPDWFCIFTSFLCISCVLRQPKRRAAQKHVIWRWNFV